MENIRDLLQNVKSTSASTSIYEEPREIKPSVQYPQRKGTTDAEIELNEERRAKVGFAPNPLCGVCNGLGFVHPTTLKGKPLYSKITICTAEGCLADSKEKWKATGQYLELKGVSARMQTFERFSVRKGTKQAYDAFFNLALGNTDKPFLLCFGPAGCGKTHLAQALTTELNKRNIDTNFYPVPSLMRTLKNAIDNKNIDEWLTALCTMPGLALDDFGMEQGTDWEFTQLEQVINDRWQNKLITVVTTNKTLSEIQLSSARIYSRLCDQDISVVVSNTATDYRLKPSKT